MTAYTTQGGETIPTFLRVTRDSKGQQRFYHQPPLEKKDKSGGYVS